MDILYNTLYTASYVGSLFVLPSARTGGGRLDPATGRPLTRDTPHVLRARLVGVGLSSLASLAIVAGIAVKHDNGAVNPKRIAELLGLWKPGISLSQLVKLVTLPLACTASLFAGPLFTLGLDRRLPGMSLFSWKLDVISTLKRLTGLRNYVIGPITEEIVFRSCIIATAYMASRSRRHLVFVAPLYFGIAHVHHAHEVFVNGGRTKEALQRGLFGSLFQFLYTSLFGFHASFLFLRTGSLLPPVLSHMFCNIMGFPDFAEAIQRHPGKKAAIIAVYLLGILAYAKSLWPLTKPALFGGSLYWR